MDKTVNLNLNVGFSTLNHIWSSTTLDPFHGNRPRHYISCLEIVVVNISRVCLPSPAPSEVAPWPVQWCSWSDSCNCELSFPPPPLALPLQALVFGPLHLLSAPPLCWPGNKGWRHFVIKQTLLPKATYKDVYRFYIYTDGTLHIRSN